MLFRDLVVCNKDWEETSEIIVISRDNLEATPIRVRAARSIFGDHQVLWFKERVVMLV